MSPCPVSGASPVVAGAWGRRSASPWRMRVLPGPQWCARRASTRVTPGLRRSFGPGRVPARGLRRYAVPGSRGPASVWRTRLRHTCGPVPQQPGTRRGRWPGQTGHGRAREVARPCRGGASAKAAHLQPAVRWLPRVGGGCGDAAALWSRCPHAMGVVQGAHRGRVVPVAGLGPLVVWVGACR